MQLAASPKSAREPHGAGCERFEGMRELVLKEQTSTRSAVSIGISSLSLDLQDAV